MPTKGQMTGMRGVYLVAAELCRMGFIASPTSRSAGGADILVTDQRCKRAFSVQVKTNAKTFDFWLVGEHAQDMVSDTHYYVLVNLKKGSQTEFFVVPSKIIAEKMRGGEKPREWPCVYATDIKEYENRWDVLGLPT